MVPGGYPLESGIKAHVRRTERIFDGNSRLYGTIQSCWNKLFENKLFEKQSKIFLLVLCQTIFHSGTPYTLQAMEFFTVQIRITRCMGVWIWES